MKKVAIILILFLASVSLIGCGEYLEFEYKWFPRVGGFRDNPTIFETTDEVINFIERPNIIRPPHPLIQEFHDYLAGFDDSFFRNSFIILVQENWFPDLEEMKPLTIRRDGTITVKSVKHTESNHHRFYIMTYVVIMPRRHVNLDFRIQRIGEGLWS